MTNDQSVTFMQKIQLIASCESNFPGKWDTKSFYFPGYAQSGLCIDRSMNIIHFVHRVKLHFSGASSRRDTLYRKFSSSTPLSHIFRSLSFSAFLLHLLLRFSRSIVLSLKSRMRFIVTIQMRLRFYQRPEYIDHYVQLISLPLILSEFVVYLELKSISRMANS